MNELCNNSDKFIKNHRNINLGLINDKNNISKDVAMHITQYDQASKSKFHSTLTSFGSSNKLFTISMRNQPLVCLELNGVKRLCLAQISNTLLKQHSYNEIHNRRVALGITCVQCSPNQLEMLRESGAMPASSRRCGTITYREAERLIKSFLDKPENPKLPTDFSFDVIHYCGWGCEGSFIPGKYNSSRAKCIQCSTCEYYFSPNKFIFHCHLSESTSFITKRTYRHPDAANFNAWRRHLYLSSKNPSTELLHLWEDVKAMFNGGNRKRMHLQSNQNQPNSKLEDGISLSTSVLMCQNKHSTSDTNSLLKNTSSASANCHHLSNLDVIFTIEKIMKYKSTNTKNELDNLQNCFKTVLNYPIKQNELNRFKNDQNKHHMLGCDNKLQFPLFNKSCSSITNNSVNTVTNKTIKSPCADKLKQNVLLDYLKKHCNLSDIQPETLIKLLHSNPLFYTYPSTYVCNQSFNQSFDTLTSDEPNSFNVSSVFNETVFYNSHLISQLNSQALLNKNTTFTNGLSYLNFSTNPSNSLTAIKSTVFSSENKNHN